MEQELNEWETVDHNILFQVVTYVRVHWFKVSLTILVIINIIFVFNKLLPIGFFISLLIIYVLICIKINKKLLGNKKLKVEVKQDE